MRLVESERDLRLVYCTIRISFLRGPLAGVTVDLPGPEERIGSAASCDLIIPDRTVSHLHGILRIERDGMRIIDASSKNGTYVNNVRINDAYLEPEMSITMGTSTFRVQLIEQAKDLPLSNHEHFGPIVGKSVAMRRIYSVLEVFANSRETVLLEGEPGTGKSAVAEAIHAAGARRDKPFVTFDCARCPPNTAEIELFGGTTGMLRATAEFRPGCVEEADGGTLVLEEIGALPIELQKKLLGLLDKRAITPFGASTGWPLDVRLIATTTRDLAVEMRKDRFREELYQRLSMRSLRLPPLRDRAEDIALIVRHFENLWYSRTGKAFSISDSVLDVLNVAPWPGHVRELRNTVERMLVYMSRDGS